MDVTFHNLMEDIVLNHVETVLRADGGCCCEIYAKRMQLRLR